MTSKQNKAYPLDAVFMDISSGVRFNRRFTSKARFLRYVYKTSGIRLINAVDYKMMSIIHLNNLEEYRNLKE